MFHLTHRFEFVDKAWLESFSRPSPLRGLATEPESTFESEQPKGSLLALSRNRVLLGYAMKPRRESDWTVKVAQAFSTDGEWRKVGCGYRLASLSGPIKHLCLHWLSEHYFGCTVRPQSGSQSENAYLFVIFALGDPEPRYCTRLPFDRVSEKRGALIWHQTLSSSADYPICGLMGYRNVPAGEDPDDGLTVLFVGPADGEDASSAKHFVQQHTRTDYWSKIFAATNDRHEMQPRCTFIGYLEPQDAYVIQLSTNPVRTNRGLLRWVHISFLVDTFVPRFVATLSDQRLLVSGLSEFSVYKEVPVAHSPHHETEYVLDGTGKHPSSCKELFRFRSSPPLLFATRSWGNDTITFWDTNLKIAGRLELPYRNNCEPWIVEFPDGQFAVRGESDQMLVYKVGPPTLLDKCVASVVETLQHPHHSTRQETIETLEQNLPPELYARCLNLDRARAAIPHPTYYK